MTSAKPDGRATLPKTFWCYHLGQPPRQVPKPGERTLPFAARDWLFGLAFKHGVQGTHLNSH